MDGENNGKPYFLMGDLGVYHDFRNPPIYPHPKTDMTIKHQPFIKIHLLLKMIENGDFPWSCLFLGM